MSRLVLGLTLFLGAPLVAGPADKRLDVYWIDVEGGGATLIVTPAGESVLIDTGYAGARDAGRIHHVATEVAGLRKIDHVVITHYHADHFGGLADLAGLMPVGTLHERGIETAPERERRDPRLEPFKAARVEKRVGVEPGSEITLRSAEGAAPTRFRFLAARQELVAPEPHRPNAEVCRSLTVWDPDASDNPNSVVMLLEQGPFRFFDGGDISWNVEGRLVCPDDRVGTVDVYQANHHGGDDAGSPVFLKTLSPRVAVFNNGPRKGGEPEHFARVKGTPSVEAIYEMHRNVLEGALNSADERIANRDEECAGNYVRMSIEPSGRRFTLSVPSTGHEKTYETRAR